MKPVTVFCIAFCLSIAGLSGDEFDQFLKPLFAESCNKCHGAKKVKGKVNLEEITSLEGFHSKPELIKELIEVIDAYDMPPEDEPELDDSVREKLLTTLRIMLRDAAASHKGGDEIKHPSAQSLSI